MSAIEDRERAIFIDLSRAMSSADAVRQLEEYLEETSVLKGPGSLIEINTGDLLLTHGVLTRIQSVTKRFGARIETLYSAVPQTQQTALDEGLSVQRPPVTKSKKFDPKQFVANAYRDLDLPFEQIPPASIRAEAKPKLSVTLDDGTKTEVNTSQDLSAETVYYKQTLRSGQVLEASGNIVIIGDAHSGSEILADGDIVVWGFLGGIAHAGRNGNIKAEIRALRIEAVQLRIAQYIARRPDRLFKQSQKGRSPEMAKIISGEIQIFEDTVER
jgi:septum formation inhibitor MinC